MRRHLKVGGFRLTPLQAKALLLGANGTWPQHLLLLSSLSKSTGISRGVWRLTLKSLVAKGLMEEVSTACSSCSVPDLGYKYTDEGNDLFSEHSDMLHAHAALFRPQAVA